MLHNFLMAAAEAGFSQAQYRSDPHKIARTFIQAIEIYDYDGIVVDIDTVTLADAVGVPVDFPENEPARSCAGMLHHLSDVEKLPPVDLGSHRRVGILIESVRLLTDYFKQEIYVRGNCDQAPFSLASAMRSPQLWMMDLMDEDKRDHITSLLEYCTDVATQMITLMAQAGAHMVSNGDSPAGPAMISPAMYREFALPYEKHCVEAAHQQGLPYGLHICGDTTAILNDIVTTQTDMVELDYLTDIHQAYAVCNDRTCFVGNIDPSGVLTLGTPDDVRRKTEELLSVYSASPRFILNAGCAIPRTAPRQNVLAMIEVAREWPGQR